MEVGTGRRAPTGRPGFLTHREPTGTLGDVVAVLTIVGFMLPSKGASKAGVRKSVTGMILGTSAGAVVGERQSRITLRSPRLGG